MSFCLKSDTTGVSGLNVSGRTSILRRDDSAKPEFRFRYDRFRKLKQQFQPCLSFQAEVHVKLCRLSGGQSVSHRVASGKFARSCQANNSEAARVGGQGDERASI